ncbi:MAG TPA: [NiFe]-hydrogenase assembly chaperone HybE, partial [Burkholderiaceae bacterium]
MNADRGFDADPSETLERAFDRIRATRFADLPLVNPALRVKAVGFRRCPFGWAGVLLTPWFMNLLIVPARGVAWQPLGVGARRRLILPAGCFEVLGGAEDEVGEYLYCPMFSTMSVFADQEGALMTADELCTMLFSAATAETIRQSNPTGLGWFAPDPVRFGDSEIETSISDSRREFLR